MNLLHLFTSPPMSQDEKDAREELEQARSEKKRAKARLRSSLKECHADAVKMQRKLADAIREVEGIKDSGELDAEDLVAPLPDEGEPDAA